MPRVHEVRPHAFAEPSTFALEGDALTWTRGATATRLRLEDVRRVHLAVAGGRQRSVRTCRLSGPAGAVVIPSSHYEAVGQFDDRLRTWSPLVRELCADLADRPGVVFSRGQSPVAFALGATVGAAVIVAGAAVAVVAGPTGWCFGALALPVLALALLLWVVEHRPGRFDPRNVPDALCPPGAPTRSGPSGHEAPPVSDDWHDAFERQSERAWAERDD